MLEEKPKTEEKESCVSRELLVGSDFPLLHHRLWVAVLKSSVVASVGSGNPPGACGVLQHSLSQISLKCLKE